MQSHRILIEVREELERSRIKFPTFPKDAIHAVSIMNEEAGESIQAAIDFTYSEGSRDRVKEELIQTAAMCFRCLETIDELEINRR